MSTHTPGPWDMETVRTSCGVVFKVGPFPWKGTQLNHACIYADYPNTDGHAICEANARLITAAPELLEALQTLISPIEGLEANLAAARNARAAIAKATGGKQ